LNELEKFKKLRVIRKFLFDFLIDQNAIYGIITTQQELANDVRDMIRKGIKSDKQLNKLYRSAIRHLSQKRFNEVTA